MALGAQTLERIDPDNGNLSDHEFRVSSQWGEDGILSFLIDIVGPRSNRFIEFGVEDYTESNTRWLLRRRNWQGLVIDGSDSNVERIRSSELYWQHQLKAVSSFITCDNINQLISDNGFDGEIGILSIDIDGVDYWVWKAITCVNPAIVVVEYNSLFGPHKTVTVPYREDFLRSKAHYSNSYYGCSLAALLELGKSKGYSFVGSNSAGNNAFFVRQDLMKAPLSELSSSEGYVRRGFREARDVNGVLSHPTFEEEQALINSLPLIDVTK